MSSALTPEGPSRSGVLSSAEMMTPRGAGSVKRNDPRNATKPPRSVKSTRAARAALAPSRFRRVWGGETDGGNHALDGPAVAPFREGRGGIGTGDDGTATVAITSFHI